MRDLAVHSKARGVPRLILPTRMISNVYRNWSSRFRRRKRPRGKPRPPPALCGRRRPLRKPPLQTPALAYRSWRPPRRQLLHAGCGPTPCALTTFHEQLPAFSGYITVSRAAVCSAPQIVLQVDVVLHLAGCRDSCTVVPLPVQARHVMQAFDGSMTARLPAEAEAPATKLVPTGRRHMPWFSMTSLQSIFSFHHLLQDFKEAARLSAEAKALAARSAADAAAGGGRAARLAAMQQQEQAQLAEAAAAAESAAVARKQVRRLRTLAVLDIALFAMLWPCCLCHI